MRSSRFQRFVYRFAFVALCWLLLAPSEAEETSAAKNLSGVEVVDVTVADAAKHDWVAPRGAKVLSVQKNSPADRAGISRNDIVVSIDGREISNAAAYRDHVGNSPPGTRLNLRLLRLHKEKLVTLVVPPLPVPQAKPADPPPKDLRKHSLVVAVETGGHRSLIRGLLFTPDGKQLVSAGDDKVVRVWDVATAKTDRIIR